MRVLLGLAAVLTASGCAFSPVNAPAPEKYTPLDSKVEIKNLDELSLNGVAALGFGFWGGD